ncbi:MAG TPA: hypothetical protein VI039_03790 [Solirubrobacterales bacterium]
MNLRTLATVSTLVAVVVLGAWAATASATVVYTSEGAIYTGPIKAEASGAITLHGIASVQCNKSLLEAEIETHGESVTAGGKVTSLTFSECNQHVTVVSKGTLEFHATSGGNGTITSSGAKVTVQFTTIFGNVHCVFGTSNTDFGSLTASASESGNAAFDIDSLSIPVVEGSFLCGSSGEVTGSYKVTTPTPMALAPPKTFHFRVEKEKTELHGAAEAAQVFTFGAVSVSCKTLTAFWPLEPGEIKFLSFGAQLAFAECTMGKENASVEPGQCFFAFNSGTLTGGIYTGKVYVVCQKPSQRVRVETNKCIYEIHPQTLDAQNGVSPATYKNVNGGKKEVTVGLALSKIKYTETENKNCLKEDETREDGTYGGSLVFKAEVEEKGGQVDFYLEDTG